MRIIENNVCKCEMCDMHIEYDDQELLPLPGYACMKVLVCPKCGQQIIMIADDYKPADKRIIVEDLNEKEEQSN